MKPDTGSELSASDDPLARPIPSALAWVWLSGFIVVLDQITKWIATAKLDYATPVAVFPGLNWTLIHNYGAAFSFLGNASGWQRWFFSTVALTVSVLFIIWLSRLPRADWRNALPLALILGGAVGNVIDRLWFGYVVDFVDVYYGTYHWPAFNIADSAISAGAVVLIIFAFLPQRNSAAQK